MLREIPGLSNASPTIYVNDLFEEYEKNGDFETVIDRAGKTWKPQLKVLTRIWQMMQLTHRR